MMSNCGVCAAETDGFICPSCVGDIERAIGDLPALLDELEVTVTRQAKVYRSSGPSRAVNDDTDPEQHLPAMLRSRDGRVALRGFAMPVNIDASEVGWVARNTLGAWARHLAESRGVDTPTDDGLTGFLLRYVESFRWDEAGADAHEEITWVAKQVERTVDRSPSRLYAGPCEAPVTIVETEERDGTVYTMTRSGKCSLSLFAWPGADEIVCDGWTPRSGAGEGCSTVHDVADRDVWLLDSVRSALLPLDVWRSALPSMFPAWTWPPRQTWHRWANPDSPHRKLFDAGNDAIGQPIYSGAHVLEVVHGAQDQLGKRGGDRRGRARRCA